MIRKFGNPKFDLIFHLNRKAWFWLKKKIYKRTPFIFTALEFKNVILPTIYIKQNLNSSENSTQNLILLVKNEEKFMLEPFKSHFITSNLMGGSSSYHYFRPFRDCQPQTVDRIIKSWKKMWFVWNGGFSKLFSK